MSKDDFWSWLAHMKTTKGWDQATCQTKLGVNDTDFRLYKEKGAPRSIGLACNALDEGLGPWRA
jgi:hypothetical protein